MANRMMMSAPESMPRVDEAEGDGSRGFSRTPPRRWLSIAWGLSPAIILLPCVVLFGRQWPYLGWLAFFAGVLNMYAWSATMLWTRRVEHWEIRAVPLALLMLVINLAIVIGGDALLSVLGIGAAANQPSPLP